MSVRLEDGVIRLEGLCRVEDAEALVALLQTSGDAPLNLTGCEGLHAAVVQAILAFGRVPGGRPAGQFVESRIAPALARAGETEL